MKTNKETQVKTASEYLKQRLLSESPFYVPGKKPKINLDSSKVNRYIFERLVANQTPLDSYNSRDIFSEKSDEIENMDTLYFVKDNKVDCLIEILEKDGEVFSKTVSQRDSPDTRGLARDIFLNYFSTKYDSIILDGIANELGRQFFFTLLTQALQRNFKVFNFVEKPKLTLPFNIEDFDNYWTKREWVDMNFVTPMFRLFKIHYV